jgi:signal transduction histidine kinase
MSSWSFMAMAILISSRLVCGSGDDSGKDIIAVLLLTILLVLLLRSVFMIVKRRSQGRNYIISGYLYDSLDKDARREIGEVLTQYQTRTRSLEISRQYALQSSAGNSFQRIFSKVSTGSIITTEMPRTVAVYTATEEDVIHSTTATQVQETNTTQT